MHTNTSSQKNQHRNILAKKKSFPQMHTNTSSQKNQHRDILAKKTKKNPNGKTKKRQIGAYRSSWVSLGRSSLVWILIRARSYGSVLLWIDDQSCGSVLWISDRSCGSMLVIGAVIRVVDR